MNHPLAPHLAQLLAATPADDLPPARTLGDLIANRLVFRAISTEETSDVNLAASRIIATILTDFDPALSALEE